MARFVLGQHSRAPRILNPYHMIRQPLNFSVSGEHNSRWRWQPTSKRAHQTRPLCRHHSCSCTSFRTLCWTSLGSGGAATRHPCSPLSAPCMISPTARSCSRYSSLGVRRTTSTTSRRTCSTLPIRWHRHLHRRRHGRSLTSDDL